LLFLGILVADAKLCLFDADLASAVEGILPLLQKSKSPIRLIQWFDSFCLTKDPTINFAETVNEATLNSMSAERLSDDHRKGVKWSSAALLIFTVRFSIPALSLSLSLSVQRDL
jgi:hypothetical protein